MASCLSWTICYAILYFKNLSESLGQLLLGTTKELHAALFVWLISLTFRLLNWFWTCKLNSVNEVFLNFFVFFFFFFFLRAALAAYRGPRLGVEWELQTHHSRSNSRSSITCNLDHSSRQHHILNPLSEARDHTRILMDTSQISFPLSHNGNSSNFFLLK